MIRKVINGVLWGSGAAVGFVAVWSIWFSLVLPKQLESMDAVHRYEEGGEVPSIPPPERPPTPFYGPYGSYSAGFSGHGTVLAPGEGEIAGLITAEGSGVADVRIRLALNNVAFSQWATTNEDGQYRVSVPYGEYEINGFDLASEGANKVLAGYIGAPTNSHATPAFSVSPGVPGEGLKLAFVRPVVKIGPTGYVHLSTEPVLSWEPYPGAVRYRVRIMESASRDDMRETGIFAWGREPEVSGTELNLAEYRDLLTVGRFYTFHITAFDEAGYPISETGRWRRERDFLLLD